MFHKFHKYICLKPSYDKMNNILELHINTQNKLRAHYFKFLNYSDMIKSIMEDNSYYFIVDDDNSYHFIIGENKL